MKIYANESDKYPVKKAKAALSSLEDLLYEVDKKHAAHFTDSEWEALGKAEAILRDYVYDITH